MSPPYIMSENYKPSAFRFNKLLIILALSGVSLGGFIYIILRPSEPLFFFWFDPIGATGVLRFLRDISQNLAQHLPEWLLFSFPNGLWAFGYTVLIAGIWSGNRSYIRYFWYSSIPVLIIGFEILQYFGYIRGVFCSQDLSFGLAGIIAGIITTIIITKHKSHKENFN